MPWLKPPEPEPMLEPFHDGLGELWSNGELVGHVATTVMRYAGCLSRRSHWWVWLIVVWADGTRERSREDYAPWSYVAEMVDGVFVWEEGSSRDGRYEFTRLPAAQAASERLRLGIQPSDF